MTRQGLLRILIHQAKNNGFNFSHWFQSTIDPSVKTLDEAIKTLASGRHYYALLFSHEFAISFWKSGEKMSFIIPSNSYTKHDRNGSLITVKRKAYVRRKTKSSAWLYHLREMAAHDDPLRYIRRFLTMEEDLKDANSSPDFSPGASPSPQPQTHPRPDRHANTTSSIQ